MVNQELAGIGTVIFLFPEKYACPVSFLFLYRFFLFPAAGIGTVIFLFPEKYACPVSFSHLSRSKLVSYAIANTLGKKSSVNNRGLFEERNIDSLVQ